MSRLFSWPYILLLLLLHRLGRGRGRGLLLLLLKAQEDPIEMMKMLVQQEKVLLNSAKLSTTKPTGYDIDQF